MEGLTQPGFNLRKVKGKRHRVHTMLFGSTIEDIWCKYTTAINKDQRFQPRIDYHPAHQ